MVDAAALAVADAVDSVVTAVDVEEDVVSYSLSSGALLQSAARLSSRRRNSNRIFSFFRWILFPRW